MSLKQFTVLLTISLFLIILELIYHEYKIQPVNYNNYIEEDYMREIIYSAENYCMKSENFGGAKIDFSNYNDELNLDFENPDKGIIIINSDCNISTYEDIIIRNKKCNYSDNKIKCNPI